MHLPQIIGLFGTRFNVYQADRNGTAESPGDFFGAKDGKIADLLPADREIIPGDGFVVQEENRLLPQRETVDLHPGIGQQHQSQQRRASQQAPGLRRFGSRTRHHPDAVF